MRLLLDCLTGALSDRFKDLEDCKVAGCITEVEYKAKRAELLASI